MPSGRKASTFNGKDTDDKYKEKRARNNKAVKCCRERSKKRALESKERTALLLIENIRLEERIKETKKQVHDWCKCILSVDGSEERRNQINEIMK